MISDLFRRLKPLYPQAIERLWIEYQTATPAERREIEELITIMAIKRLDMMIGDERLILDAPPPGLIGQGEYTIGHVTYPSLAPYPFRVGRNELLRHLFILGPTGTGKSTLLLNLLLQITDVPFMIFDFKKNYRCLLSTKNARLVVFTVGRKTAPLALNVLTPPEGVHFEEWANALSDTISTAYLLLHGARNVLKEALLAAHELHRDEATLAHAHTLLQAELARTRSGSRRYGWLESSTRALEELTKGHFGDALNATTARTIGELLTHQVIFELHGFGDDQKRFFCLYCLQAILLLRKNGNVPREQLQHLLIFDEAHNIFPRERPGEISVPARLAREVREYGEAIIAATQQSDVSESLIANSGFKFILRCDYPRDVYFASQLLQIEPKWLPKLPLGTGIARLPVRYYGAFQFTFDQQPIKNVTVPDNVVHEQWSTHPLSVEQHPVERRIAVSQREELLLRDVNEHPINTITERYTRLQWNPKTGNTIKNNVIEKRLATFEAVTTTTGIVKILTLTDAGEAYLRGHGMVTTRRRHGGAEHEYWKHTVKRKLEALGYNVTEEFPIGNGKTVDLHAVRDHEEVWVEIETGRSSVQANMEKCRALVGRKVFIFTRNELRGEQSLARDCVLLTAAEIDQLK